MPASKMIYLPFSKLLPENPTRSAPGTKPGGGHTVSTRVAEASIQELIDRPVGVLFQKGRGVRLCERVEGETQDVAVGVLAKRKGPPVAGRCPPAWVPDQVKIEVRFAISSLEALGSHLNRAGVEPVVANGRAVDLLVDVYPAVADFDRQEVGFLSGAGGGECNTRC